MSEAQNTQEDEQAIADYLSGQRSLDDLTETQMELAYDRGTGEETSTTEVTNPPETSTTEVTTPLVDSAVEDEVVPAKYHQKIREMQVELNQQKQISETNTKKLQRLRDDESYRNSEFGVQKETLVDPNKDYLTDQHLAKIDSQEQQIKRLEEIFNKQESYRIQSEQTIAHNTENSKLFAEINKLQSDFPTLKTTLEFSQFDKKYGEWQSFIGPENVDKYMADESYRNMMDGKGYKPEFPLSDLNTAVKIYEGVSQYRQDKKDGYNTSFTRTFKSTDYYDSLVKSKYSQHQAANDEALNLKFGEIASENQVLTTSTAPSETNDAISMINEMERLSNMSNPTPQDDKRLQEIGNYIDKYM